MQEVELESTLPGQEVPENITLAFYPGAKIGVIGTNGSGKKPLLRIMAGVDKVNFLGEAKLYPGHQNRLLRAGARARRGEDRT